MDIPPRAVENYLRENPACVVTFFASCVLYYISHFVSKLVPAYNKLSYGDQAEWCSRVVSNIHAFVATFAGLKMMASDVYDERPFTAWSDEGGHYANILIGYFAYDVLLCLAHKQLRTFITFLHHFIGLSFYLVVCISHEGQYLTTLWLASELTTPFVNLRWFLAIMKKSSTLMYTVNGILMTLGFLLWRVLIIPGLVIRAHYYSNSDFHQTVPYIRTLIPVAVSSITLLNAYWTYLMIKGIIKFLQKGPKTHQKAA